MAEKEWDIVNDYSDVLTRHFLEVLLTLVMCLIDCFSKHTVLEVFFRRYYDKRNGVRQGVICNACILDSRTEAMFHSLLIEMIISTTMNFDIDIEVISP